MYSGSFTNPAGLERLDSVALRFTGRAALGRRRCPDRSNRLHPGNGLRYQGTISHCAGRSEGRHHACDYADGPHRDADADEDRYGHTTGDCHRVPNRNGYAKSHCDAVTRSSAHGDTDCLAVRPYGNVGRDGTPGGHSDHVAISHNPADHDSNAIADGYSYCYAVADNHFRTFCCYYPDSVPDPIADCHARRDTVSDRHSHAFAHGYPYCLPDPNSDCHAYCDALTNGDPDRDSIADSDPDLDTATNAYAGSSERS